MKKKEQTKSEIVKILILVADLYEDLELHYPRLRLIEEGKKVIIAGVKAGQIYKSKHGYECKADLSFDEVSVSEYSAVIVPGGYAPDKLRAIPQVLDIIRKFNIQKKMIAFICHGGWVPVSANVLEGVTCTSYNTIKDDIVNAGGKWVDKEVVVDKNFISSRNPNDLPMFCSAIIKYFNK